jgi:hypothetical protein
MESEGDNSGEDAMNGSFHLIDLVCLWEKLEAKDSCC